MQAKAQRLRLWGTGLVVFGGLIWVLGGIACALLGLHPNAFLLAAVSVPLPLAGGQILARAQALRSQDDQERQGDQQEQMRPEDP